MTWRIIPAKQVKYHNPILIEGLPGIGNVGKVAVDFIIDTLGAEKVADLISCSFPNSAFVNEENLLELPRMELYWKKGKKHDILFLAGDVQPISEESCYEFCNTLLDMLDEAGCKEVITLGGIGLSSEPKVPQVFCTGNSKQTVQKYLAGTTMKSELYGVVGPVVGVTGLLIGLAQRRKIAGVALLAETYAHPMYLGMKGARALIKVINKKMNLKINIKDLDKEIEELEQELQDKTKEITKAKSKRFMQKLRGKFGKNINYIG